ncbi:MAG: ABC transporter ATP-binding protein [Gammaproteobacteria bacterium]|nr:ABC transporter ATP-binding protein [Gammaproteobacteria bacterium]
MVQTRCKTIRRRPFRGGFDEHRDAGGHVALSIGINGVDKWFGSGTQRTLALREVEFEVAAGEFVVLVGESGCGKTTLLRMLAGLETPSRGRVHIDGRSVRAPSLRVGLVFQRPVLLPWRTVLDNVMLPVELARGRSPLAGEQAADKAMRLLSLLGIDSFAGHRPQHLSGGMQQRAALARTLMLDPAVLLMDEPFAALDAITREQLMLELLKTWQLGEQTVVFITHDIAEAVFLADRVLLMSRRPGTIVQSFEVALPRPRCLSMRYEPVFMAQCREIHTAMATARAGEAQAHG